MKKFVSLAITAFIIASCSVNGLTSDYGKLSDEQKVMVVDLENFSNLDPRKIYRLSAAELKQDLKNNDKSLVYVFTNGCTSTHCKPLIVYENYANDNGYKLYLVMNGYGSLDKTLVQPRNAQLFSIDNEVYKSNLRGKYTRLFENELTGKPADNKELTGSLLVFINGKFERALLDIEELNKSVSLK